MRIVFTLEDIREILIKEAKKRYEGKVITIDSCGCYFDAIEIEGKDDLVGLEFHLTD